MMVPHPGAADRCGAIVSPTFIAFDLVSVVAA
jgi:hypothetical protein